MESIQHFSHSKHPLFLKKLCENKEEFKCYGCQEPISEKDRYYACEEGSNKCSFYLHKKCADLPKEINLPCHKHPLTLLAYPHYYGLACICNICRRSDWKWFIYHCFLCKFDIDIICCSIFQERNNILQHEGHSHPLTFHPRPSLFHCDACNTKDEDMSYFCNTCNFWIHKSCASAPKSITVAHHDDPLLLTYSLPEKYHNFEQNCEICHKRVESLNWVYYCDNCRYFNHLKCATSNTPSTVESEIQDEEDDAESRQIMQLPFPNPESVPDPTSLFVANNSTRGAYDNMATEMLHRLHHHPLSINDDACITTNNLHEYNEILCDGCVRPISVPFYSCSKCDFFLHRICAELPEELQCPHYEHPIKVMIFGYSYFNCSFCLRTCNGFLCKCESCNLKLDIGCATNSIPSRIKHNSHVHPLVTRHIPRNVQNLNCNACGKGIVKSHLTHTYSCKVCSFNLCIICVKYPGSVRHKYDRHSIPLTYPPIKDHPSDFICEICEKDINPKYWMYHCQECNQSFHTDCFSPIDRYSNLKFGGTFKIENVHKHPLALVRNRRSEYASRCYKCGSDCNGFPILECAPCGFKLCTYCAEITFVKTIQRVPKTVNYE